MVFQTKSSLFTNKYVFYSYGTFKHFYRTDDGQLWYGQGTYTDKGKKRVLRFGDADFMVNDKYLVVHYEAGFERTLKRSGNRYLSKDYYHTTKDKTVVFAER